MPKQSHLVNIKRNSIESAREKRKNPDKAESDLGNSILEAILSDLPPLKRNNSGSSANRSNHIFTNKFTFL